MLFGRRYPVSDYLSDWIPENFHRAVDRDLLFRATALVPPTRDFITAPNGGGERALAQFLAARGSGEAAELRARRRACGRVPRERLWRVALLLRPCTAPEWR